MSKYSWLIEVTLLITVQSFITCHHSIKSLQGIKFPHNILTVMISFPLHSLSQTESECKQTPVCTSVHKSHVTQLYSELRILNKCFILKEFFLLQKVFNVNGRLCSLLIFHGVLQATFDNCIQYIHCEYEYKDGSDSSLASLRYLNSFIHYS